MILGTHINNFQWGHLLVWNFYKMFIGALKRKLGGEFTMFQDPVSGEIATVGLASPYPLFWNYGYQVHTAGTVFGECILIYTPPTV